MTSSLTLAMAKAGFIYGKKEEKTSSLSEEELSKQRKAKHEGFTAGMLALYKGVSILCPYPERSVKYNKWYQGYHRALEQGKAQAKSQNKPSAE